MIAQELRIGNLVYDSRRIVVPITAISKDWFLYGEDGQCAHEYIYPILLTPEWLKRAGFKQWDTDTKWCHEKIKFIIDEDSKGFIIELDSEQDIRVPFVHTFQNAIYALTIEELTFNK